MTAQPADVIASPDSNDSAALALRDHSVRQGWALVEAAERMEPELSKRLQRDLYKAQAAHAKATLAPLKPWPASPERVIKVMSSPPNQFRMRRVLDLVSPGDRILDIGVNYGYLSGVLQRDGALGSTYVLRPGVPSGPFRPSGPVAAGPGVTAEIFAEIASRSTAAFTVRRAAAVCAATT